MARAMTREDMRISHQQPLTPEVVRARVAEIRKYAGDDEGAHGLEDDLYRDVLKQIAKGTTHGRALCEEALKTQRIKFERWAG